MRKLNWKWVVIGLVLIVVVAASGFIVWASTPLGPMNEALQALESDGKVTVTGENGWYVFTPTGDRPTTGFIFYPGGRVDARAYAPQVRAIAENGYLTIITPMPLNLAIFGINKADDVIQAFPAIQHWAIGGHSLGGAMAARYVQSKPQAVEGLVFWASYPDIDLSGLNFQALSIFGTNDAVAKGDGIRNSGSLLPSNLQFVPIEGGNHSQFGWYGLQPGDNAAGLSRAEQQAQTVQATSDLLAKLGG